MPDSVQAPLTYGAYLRVPELLALQVPLGSPPVHDELLFIVLQQAQELWFKQVLHELSRAIPHMLARQLLEAARLLDRVNRIWRVLADEVQVMETLRPIEFQEFRHLLTPSSGFESHQFRELEFASGLRDDHLTKLIGRVMDIGELRRRWPLSLHDGLLEICRSVGDEPELTLHEIYSHPERHPELYLVCEALSEYEIRFQAWRFHHIKLVERVIGDRSAGTGGSEGSSYLTRTMGYRCFPELMEARNRLVARGS